MSNRWFRMDADFFDHAKALQIGLAARGLFIASIAYCSRFETDGRVPAAVIRRLIDDDQVDADKLVAELVDVHLWDSDQGGYHVHDYLDYQPSRADRDAEREAVRDRQRRSRAKRSDRHADVTRDKNERHADVTRESRTDVTGRDVTETPGGPNGPPPPAEHPDARPLCERLATRIEGWSGQRPKITARWLTAARQLLDRDGLTVEGIEQLIDWATGNEFWRPNILSMPKLREKRLTLAGQMQRDQQAANGRTRGSPEPAWKGHAERRYADAQAKERHDRE